MSGQEVELPSPPQELPMRPIICQDHAHNLTRRVRAISLA